MALEIIDKSIQYKSPVSFGPVFPWSEKTLWMMIAGFMIILISFNLLLPRLQ